MSSPATLFILFFVLLSSVQDTAGEFLPTAYELLGDYDFPMGLLPQGVRSYELDQSTGRFKVYLEKACSFPVSGYNLRYKSTISGEIAKDKLKNLKGISVKVLFLWVNIGEVTRRGDELYFSVGIASTGFVVDNFVDSPQCGCGFNCNGGIGEKNDTKLKLKGFASAL